MLFKIIPFFILSWFLFIRCYMKFFNLSEQILKFLEFPLHKSVMKDKLNHPKLGIICFRNNNFNFRVSAALFTVKPRLIWHVKLENHVDFESILCCFSQRKLYIHSQRIRFGGKGSWLSWPIWTNHVKLNEVLR
jgi:hypothetical protein